MTAPYPADTRAKGWRFELDYERIEQSSTWALASARAPEVPGWLLRMWMCAWKQVPCGSFPSDEQVIAAMIGMPERVWARHRDVLMRGWTEADDGRVYHVTITARVLEMLEYRAKAAKRVADHKARMREQRAGNTLPAREQPASNDTGTGTGTTEVSDVLRTSSSSQTTKGGKRPTIPCPYDEIVDAYHQALPDLPRVVLRDGKTWAKRQRAMRELWGWVLSSRKSDGTKRAETGDEALTWIRGYFERAAENDFIAGRTPPGQGHEGWRAGFDYLLTERGMRQVIENTRAA